MKISYYLRIDIGNLKIFGIICYQLLNIIHFMHNTFIPLYGYCILPLFNHCDIIIHKHYII